MSAVEFLFGVAASLVASVIEKKHGQLSFVQEKKIQTAVDQILLLKFESLSRYLEDEGVDEEIIKNLGITAKDQVKSIIDSSKLFVENGLNSSKITDILIENIKSEKNASQLNKELIFQNIDTYKLLLKSFIDSVVSINETMTDWETSKFKVIFEKLSKIIKLLERNSLNFETIELQKNEKNLFSRLIQHRENRQIVSLSINELTEHDEAARKFEHLFVFPEIKAFVPVFGKEEDVRGKDENRKYNEEKLIVISHKNVQISNIDSFRGADGIVKLMLIEAPAGYGKTTFSKWLQVEAIKNGIIPILFNMREVSQKVVLPDLHDALANEVGSVFRKLFDAKDVYHWAEDRKLVLIFDGFDEIADENRDRVFDWVQDLVCAHPNVHCRLTSRPLTTNHLDKLRECNWLQANILPFDDARILKYIENFQSHGPSQHASISIRTPAELASCWSSDQTIAPLTSNPLLLSTLLIIHYLDGELPQGRAGLYKRYIEGMLGRRDGRKQIFEQTIKLSKDEKLGILRIIAINLMESGKETVEEKIATEWLQPFFANHRIPHSPQRVLSFLDERTGLIAGPGQYGFVHKSIGEFLVADAIEIGHLKTITGTQFDRKLLARKCTSDRWLTATFLWAGTASHPEVTKFIDALLSHKHSLEAPFYKLRLAGGLIHDQAHRFEREWRENTIWRFINLISRKGSLLDSFLEKNCSTKNGNHLYELDIYGCRLLDLSSSLTTNSFLADAFKKGWIKAEDWKGNIGTFNKPIWLTFAKNLEYDRDFIKKAPKELSHFQTMIAVVEWFEINYEDDFIEKIHKSGDAELIASLIIKTIFDNIEIERSNYSKNLSYSELKLLYSMIDNEIISNKLITLLDTEDNLFINSKIVDNIHCRFHAIVNYNIETNEWICEFIRKILDIYCKANSYCFLRHDEILKIRFFNRTKGILFSPSATLSLLLNDIRKQVQHI